MKVNHSSYSVAPYGDKKWIVCHNFESNNTVWNSAKAKRPSKSTQNKEFIGIWKLKNSNYENKGSHISPVSRKI